MPELELPPSVERRNKLDISLGYCSEVHPERLESLGPALEVRVDEPAQLVDVLLHDALEDRLYFVNHLRSRGKEWELACFAKHGAWTFFSSVHATALAYSPKFGDGQRRRLCCGGTRIIGTRSLEGAAHRAFASRAEELTAAAQMNLDLSEAMTGKNLSNGFNIGGSKALVHVGEPAGKWHVEPADVPAFARFMARCHNSITQALPYFMGTGSDLNFHEHGDAYYDLCSRISPNYTGSRIAASRWGRVTTGDTTAPTAAGVVACIEGVARHLGVAGEDRSILVKGLGGVGLAIARRQAELGWRVHATEIRTATAASAKAELGGAIELVAEEDWPKLPRVTIFSPNAASASVTRENLPVLRRLGVRAIVGGENNTRDKGVDRDLPWHEHGILTFADFLLNGGGAWIVDAEMVERPVEGVHEWIAKYQVPTALATIEAAREQDASPESVFRDFIARKVKELLA